MTLYSGRQVVSVVGTPRRIDESPAVVKVLIVETLGTNTVDIYLGDQQVEASAGYESGLRLRPGDRVRISDVMLRDFWINSTVAGEGVHWLCLH